MKKKEKCSCGINNNESCSDCLVIKSTNKYKHFNHHHELDQEHQMVDFGDGEFIANTDGIPLLKALNEIGLRTRTHHIERKEDGSSFVSILLDNVSLEIKTVREDDAFRTKYNGKKELLICWKALPKNT